MAYYRKNNYYGKKKYYKGRRNKYTQAEKIAFRLGREKKIRESINNNKGTRVYSAFCKGYAGSPQGNKQPLF